MSAKYMGAVWELDLPHNEAWVLMAMADHADHEGQNVFPAIPLIAWKTGYDERTVHRMMANLRERGIIIPDGIAPSGTVIYRIELAHVERKPAYVRRQAGRPSKYETFSMNRKKG